MIQVPNRYLCLQFLAFQKALPPVVCFAGRFHALLSAWFWCWVWLENSSHTWARLPVPALLLLLTAPPSQLELCNHGSAATAPRRGGWRWRAPRWPPLLRVPLSPSARLSPPTAFSTKTRGYCREPPGGEEQLHGALSFLSTPQMTVPSPFHSEDDGTVSFPLRRWRYRLLSTPQVTVPSPFHSVDDSTISWGRQSVT